MREDTDNAGTLEEDDGCISRWARLRILRQLRALHGISEDLMNGVESNACLWRGPMKEAIEAARIRLAAYREALEHLHTEARKSEG